MATRTAKSRIANQPLQGFGENVQISVTDGILTVTVDLNYRGGISSTGKTTRVASTNGNQTVPGTDVRVGFNAYVK